MRDISEYFIFQQESTSAKETVDLSTETSSLNPPNSPDLNPVNFSLFVNPGASVQGEGQHFSWVVPAYPDCWDELDQHIIDKAIKQWHTRLRACIKAKGGHFEHKP